MNPLLIGAALGLGKSMLIDQPREERQRQLAAETALYSPFTGLKPQLPEESDPLGAALQGAALGTLFAGGSGGADQQLLQNSPQVTSTSFQNTAQPTYFNTDAQLLRMQGLQPQKQQLMS